MDGNAARSTKAPGEISLVQLPASSRDPELVRLKEIWRKRIGFQNLSKGTIKLYLDHLEIFLHFLSWRKVSYINVDFRVLEDWVAQLREDGLATSTIKGRLSALGSFYRTLGREGVVSRNPFELVDPIRKERRIPRFLSEAQILLMRDAARKTRERLIFEFFYATGCRAREAWRVDLADLNLGIPAVRLLGKGRKERLAPLTHSAVQCLRAWLLRRSAILEKRGRQGESALFVGHFGTRLSYQRFYWTIKHLARKAGIVEDVHPHMLRHSFGTHVLNHGADLRKLQELMGHDSIESTQVYTHVAKEATFKAYAMAHPAAKWAVPGAPETGWSDELFSRPCSNPKCSTGPLAAAGLVQAPPEDERPMYCSPGCRLDAKRMRRRQRSRDITIARRIRLGV